MHCHNYDLTIMDMILPMLRYVHFSSHFQYIFLLTASINWHYDCTHFIETQFLPQYAKIGENFAGSINSAQEGKLNNINPLKTKRRLLYLKTQSVPLSKHFSPWL